MKQYQYAPLLALALATGSVGWAQQSKGETSKNWHQLGLKESGFYGINLNKAYEFLKARNAKSQTVVVAVMDSGIDTLHEDLKPVLWVNPGEIPGNGKDDDKNGYPDDRYGWNFLGGKDGTNINEFSSEASRLYHQWRSKYEGKDVYGLTAADQAEYELWKKAKRELFGNEENKIDVTLFSRMYKTLMKSDSVVRKGLGNDNYTGSDLNAYKPQNSDEKKAKDQLLNFMKLYEKMDAPAKGLLEELGEFIGSEEKKEKERTTAPRDWRGEIVKDNPDDLNDRNYGNSDVMAGRARHGTHVAGIIGAVRNNGKGMDGVADNVRLMIVRVVPDGDEQDKDVANGIRYAVDNGAQVINMSFGKAISPQKAWVDEAVKYAERKGVLLVHAAGNDNEDVDVNDNFPVALYNDGKRATNWITVGASGDPTNGGLVANFSNYGKKEVDVFAPGVDIYSTVPGGNTYDKISGTSMAAPVVSGLAALLLEYFPTLSAQQVKMVIERSAVPIYTKVVKPGSEDKVPFVDLSKTGGIVDAFAAVKLAATLKGERKVATTAKAVSLAKPAKAKKDKGGQ